MHAESDRSAGVASLDYAGPGAARRVRLDGMALATHLTGWLLVIGVFEVLAVFVVPRFEDIFKDFKLALPAATMQLLWMARDGSFLVLLLGVGVAHSFAAAWWYRRAGRGTLLAYRIVLFLLLAGSILFVLAALHLPLVSLLTGLSGGPPPASTTTTGPAR